MFLGTFKSNVALIAVFGFLFVTFLLLTIGELGPSTGWHISGVDTSALLPQFLHGIPLFQVFLPQLSRHSNCPFSHSVKSRVIRVLAKAFSRLSKVAEGFRDEIYYIILSSQNLEDDATAHLLCIFVVRTYFACEACHSIR